MTDAELDARLERLSDEDLQTIANDNRHLYTLIEVYKGAMHFNARMAREIIDLRQKIRSKSDDNKAKQITTAPTEMEP